MPQHGLYAYYHGAAALELLPKISVLPKRLLKSVMHILTTCLRVLRWFVTLLDCPHAYNPSLPEKFSQAEKTHQFPWLQGGVLVTFSDQRLLLFVFPFRVVNRLVAAFIAVCSHLPHRCCQFLILRLDFSQSQKSYPYIVRRVFMPNHQYKIYMSKHLSLKSSWIEFSKPVCFANHNFPTVAVKWDL